MSTNIVYTASGTDFTSVYPTILVDINGNPINILTSGAATYVSSLNTLTGAVVVSGLGSITVSTNGQTINVSGANTSSITTPNPTTDYGIATWSGTAGVGLRTSTIEASGSTINASGDLTIAANHGNGNLLLQGNFLDIQSSSIFAANTNISLHNDQLSLNGQGGIFGGAVNGVISLTASGNALLTSNTGFVALSSFSGVTTNNNIVPTISGINNVGTSNLPFSGVYANQYETTQISGNTTASTLTVNWNAGSSQIVNFLNGVSGNCTVTLSNGIPGSTYALQTINNTSGTTGILWGGGNVLWAFGISGNTTPTAGAIDLFTFYYNGSKYLGNPANAYA